MGVFRVSKPKKSNAGIMEGGYAKLTFRFSLDDKVFAASAVSQNLQAVLIQTIKKLGWNLKAGTPPRSQNERKLRDLLSRMR